MSPIPIFYRSVRDPDTLINAEVHIRASRTKEYRVYVKLPFDFSVGARIDKTTVETLVHYLQEASSRAAEGLQSVEVLATDDEGNAHTVRLPKGFRATKVRIK